MLDRVIHQLFLYVTRGTFAMLHSLGMLALLDMVFDVPHDTLGISPKKCRIVENHIILNKYK